ncbi:MULTISPECIES: VirB3 family type IV secretion system protein [unclassified Neorhizobium]|uniref:VirB3 family type IV secretion system protein n=1 Tax=unclassified Neorhizobium TaxID=2629175 RepID=UPI001FF5CAA5|nr:MULTISPECIES: VirB3 family type IV secretion system protein [unclassified Neorhizobium]MCJ9670393.1 VirB3 family type IV secretion system protein [Neorhizobium sp. SHOUNA12B]MCJ9746294.1 VirB3 family type IV secretion system protein [Neorhizobium sp. SHOUNA12A]
MKYTPVFLGLTREVSFAGLPVMYLVTLVVFVILGFIITKSFAYLIIASAVGYVTLRGLAAYDPKIIRVFVTTMQRTRMSPSLLRGEGVVYRA